MKVLIAGSSGAIGLPLIKKLAPQHEVFAITSNHAKVNSLEQLGATPLVVDVLDKDEVRSSMGKVQPEIIIDMLTRLPKRYTSEEMEKAALKNAETRLKGGLNLQLAGEAFGVRRYIAQSCGFWYESGQGLANEDVPFAFNATPGIAKGTTIYQQIEKRLFSSPSIEGVALRFGFFYGPGTWFVSEGDMGRQVLNHEFPQMGSGEGVWNFIHIEDAAQAIVNSLSAKPGIYNIVNDQPIALKEWLPAFANYVKGPAPKKLTEEEAKKLFGEDAVYAATKLRGASNRKAKDNLSFLPRPLEWLK